MVRAWLELRSVASCQDLARLASARSGEARLLAVPGCRIDAGVGEEVGHPKARARILERRLPARTVGEEAVRIGLEQADQNLGNDPAGDGPEVLTPVAVELRFLERVVPERCALLEAVGLELCQLVLGERRESHRFRARLS